MLVDSHCVGGQDTHCVGGQDTLPTGRIGFSVLETLLSRVEVIQALAIVILGGLWSGLIQPLGPCLPPGGFTVGLG